MAYNTPACPRPFISAPRLPADWKHPIGMGMHLFGSEARRMESQMDIKRTANLAVLNAIKEGKLTRMPCERCGSRAIAHHEDYNAPLSVTWLCSLHHYERHQAIGHYDIKAKTWTKERLTPAPRLEPVVGRDEGFYPVWVLQQHRRQGAELQELKERIRNRFYK